MKCAAIRPSELGTRCCMPQLGFLDGERCPIVTHCRYPERKDCKAIDTEIQYLLDKAVKVNQSIAERLRRLAAIKSGKV